MKKYSIFIFLGLFVVALVSVSAPVAAVEKPDFDLESKSAVLMDAQTGEVLYSKDSHQKLRPASITKIMTMLLTMESLEEGRVKLTDKVTTSEHAAQMGGSQIWLEPGEEMTVQEMIKAVAIVSANDACVALAEYLYGTEEDFVAAMNDKAQELGMEKSYFYNTNGLPTNDSETEGNYTTAHDVALMSQALIEHSQVLEYTSIWTDHLREGDSFLRNTNDLVRFYDGADGLKTGYTTEAGFCLSATAQRKGMRFIAVVMKAPNSKVRFAEAKKLLSYAFNIHRSISVVQSGEDIGEVRVFKGQQKQVTATAKEDLNVVVTKGEEDNITQQTKLDKEVVAPIKSGAKVGEIVVTKEEQVLGRVDLVAKKEVKKANLIKIIIQLFQKFISKLVNSFA
ncbi:D-alanyl-D-alanine carboxypeptidase family protein [Halanaerobaculum tunisiense]